MIYVLSATLSCHEINILKLIPYQISGHCCPQCGKSVVNLSRHVQFVHLWEPEQARSVISQYRLRKPRAVKPKNCRKYKKCPIVKCPAIVKRLPQHLVSVHKLDSKSTKYRQILMSKDLDFSDGEAEYDKPGDIIPEKDVSILKRFEKWSMSPLGGRREFSTAAGYSRDVKKLLLHVGGSYSMYNLFDVSKVNEGLDRLTIGKKARTSKGIITALERFCSFYIDELEKVEQPFYSPEGTSHNKPNKGDIPALLNRLHNISVSFNDAMKEDKWDVIRRDTEDFLTTQEVNEFYSSEEYRRLSSIFESLPTQPDDGTIRFMQLRTFIFVLVFLSNGHRPGPLCNMKVTDYLNMTVCADDDGNNIHKILTNKHKTSKSHGPVEILLNDEIKRYFDIYFQHIRPRFDKTECEFFFLNTQGQQVRNTDQSKLLRQLLKRAGIDKRVTCTLVRKRIVTLTAATGTEEDRSMVAELMKHNPATAKTYYDLSNKNRNNVKAYNLIRKCNTVKEVPLAVYDQPTTSQVLFGRNPIHEESDNEFYDNNENGLNESMRGSIQGESENESQDNYENGLNESMKSSIHGREEKMNEVQFQVDSSVSNSGLKESMKKSIPRSGEAMKKVQPEVDNLRSKETDEFASSLEKLTSHQRNSGKGSHKFLANDVAYLVKTFQKELFDFNFGSISKPNIVSKLKMQLPGREILKKYTPEQLHRRLKHEKEKLKLKQ